MTDSGCNGLTRDCSLGTFRFRFLRKTKSQAADTSSTANTTTYYTLGLFSSISSSTFLSSHLHTFLHGKLSTFKEDPVLRKRSFYDIAFTPAEILGITAW